MAPGGEMFRFYSAFRRERTAYPGGMNASPTEKTERVRKSTNTNSRICRIARLPATIAAMPPHTGYSIPPALCAPIC